MEAWLIAGLGDLVHQEVEKYFKASQDPEEELLRPEDEANEEALDGSPECSDCP